MINGTVNADTIGLNNNDIPITRHKTLKISDNQYIPLLRALKNPAFKI